jgi:hypothetical protein
MLTEEQLSELGQQILREYGNDGQRHEEIAALTFLTHVSALYGPDRTAGLSIVLRCALESAYGLGVADGVASQITKGLLE